MKSLLRRTLRGPVLAQDAGGGWWRLTAAADGWELYLKVPRGVSDAPLRGGGIESLEVEWRDAGVAVRVSGHERVSLLDGATVIIHEARSRLYEALPLAGFDADARRFWRRVFWLIRIPGGRHLLRLVARRKRRRGPASH